MISYVRLLYKKSIVKVFIGSGASTIVKMITSVILSKIIANELGPTGMGLIGQLGSFLAIVLLFASGGYQNGIISYTSFYRTNDENLSQFLKPTLKLTLIISCICSIILFLCAIQFSEFIFKNATYNYIIYCAAITIIIYSLNTYFNSFLNGMSDYKILFTLNIINSIFSLLVSIVLIYWLGLKGALLAVVLSQTISSLALFRYIRKYKLLFNGFTKSVITKLTINKLLPFLQMTIFSAILLPVSQILIRNMLLHTHGSFQAGIWEAVNRISGLYLMIIINVMLVYYLPKLSAINSKQKIVNELKNGALFFGFIMVAVGICVFFLRHWIIHFFLSDSFEPIEGLVLPQLIGDFLKILYYLFAYFAIAKSLTRYYIATEILFFIIYIALSYTLVPNMGVKGAVYAYIVMNFAALLLHLFFIGKIFLNSNLNTALKFLFYSNAIKIKGNN